MNDVCNPGVVQGCLIRPMCVGNAPCLGRPARGMKLHAVTYAACTHHVFHMAQGIDWAGMGVVHGLQSHSSSPAGRGPRGQSLSYVLDTGPPFLLCYFTAYRIHSVQGVFLNLVIFYFLLLSSIHPHPFSF